MKKYKLLFNGLILFFVSMAIGQTTNQDDVQLYVRTANVNPKFSVLRHDGKVIATVSGNDSTQIRLFDSETGLELRALIGHTDFVNSIAFSRNGKLLASGSRDAMIKIWDIESGEILHTLEGHSDGVNTVEFDFSGMLLVSGSSDKTVRQWNVETGQELSTLSVHNASVSSVAISSNMLASGSWDNTIHLQNLTSGGVKVLQTGTPIKSIVFSPDGKTLAATSWGDGVIGASDKLIQLSKSVRFWDTASGKEIGKLQNNEAVHFFAFSKDGKMIATASSDDSNSVKIWDVKKASVIKKIDARDLVSSVSFSPDDKRIIISNIHSNYIQVIDINSGKEISGIKSEVAFIEKIAVSKNGEWLATSSSTSNYSGNIRIWNLKNGNFSSLIDNETSIKSVSLSPDGKFLAFSSFEPEETSIKYWDVEAKKLIKIIKTKADDQITFSPDGKTFAATSDNELKIWNAETAQEIQSIPFKNIVSFDYSPNSNLIVTGSFYDGSIRVWDINTGKQVEQINCDCYGRIRFVAFNSEGTEVEAVFEDLLENILVWYNATENFSYSPIYKENIQVKNGLSFTRPGLFEKIYNGKVSNKLIFEHTQDGRVKISDQESMEEILTLVEFEKDGWLVKNSENLFDGSPNAWKQSYWRFDNNTFDYAPVEAFFKEFYCPGLLQDTFNGNKIEPPKQDLSKIDIRQPFIKISTIDEKPTDSSDRISTAKKTVKVKVEITDNISKGRQDDFPGSSNANDVRLFRNGSLVKLWDKKTEADNKNTSVFELPESDGCRKFAAAKDSPRKAVCETDVEITAGENEFTAYGFNHDNVKSNDTNASVVGAESLKRKGKLQILAIGVDKYIADGHDLKFAVKDASDFGVELRRQQSNLGNYDTPEIVQLSDTEATKRNILYALERFAKGEKAVKPENVSAEVEKKIAGIGKTQPEDVLIVYFAGHGTAAKDRFYLIPTDGFPSDAKDEKTRIELLQKQSVSDLELDEAFRELDAGKLLFVIDACNSGQALEAEEKRRGPMNSKGLAQLAYEKGMYILTAAQSYQAALEVSKTATGEKIEHGLLTYSLLEGLNTLNGDDNKDKQITEREWFNFAVQEVPKMQLEAMMKRSVEFKQTGRGAELVYVSGDNKNADPNDRKLQTPRVFYKRETDVNSLIIAKP